MDTKGRDICMTGRCEGNVGSTDRTGRQMVDEKTDITDHYNKHSGQSMRCDIKVVETGGKTGSKVS